MIIRKKNLKTKKTQSSSNVIQPRSNIIKKEDLLNNADNKTVQPKNKEKEETNQTPKEEDITKKAFEKIDISSIEFKERSERRRGDRRRGYRRIDERSLVTRAQAEANTIKELAAREGYKNGLSRAEKELKEIKENFVEFLSMKNEMYEEFYPHFMELSLEMAKKIIKKETDLSKEVIKEIIMETLDELNSDTEKITVKVNPEDLEFASVSLPDMINEKGITAKFNVIADESVTKGGCIVVANNGVIDADIKTQLAVLQNAFGIYQGGL